MLRQCTRRVAPVLLFSIAVSAQVPDGHFAHSAYTGQVPGTGGIWVGVPRPGLTPTAVSSLPADLVGPALGGANCLEIRQADGSIYAGEIGGTGASIELHLLELTGLAVTQASRWFVGTSNLAAGGGIHALAQLPNGDVLVVATDLVNAPPLSGAAVGLVVPGSGTVTPVTLTGLIEGTPNALALDASGGTAYLGTFRQLSGRVYSFPVQGGTLTPVAQLGFGIVGLTRDNNGQLLATLFNGAVVRINPSNGQVQALPNSLILPGSARLEAATGNLLADSGNLPVLIDTAGNLSVLAPVSPWSVFSGIDVRHSPQTYGQGTAAQDTYSWVVRPNPGGAPTLGNNAFSVTVAASGAGAQASAVVFAAAPGNLVFAGVTIWLDVSQIALSLPLPSGPTMTLPIPIPNDPMIAGQPLFLQSFHLDPGGLGAASGLRFAVF